MRNTKRSTRQGFGAWFLTLLLVLPLAAGGQTTPAQSEPAVDSQPLENSVPDPPAPKANSAQLPDSAGATPSPVGAQGQPTPNPVPQSSSEKGTLQKPLGTAAAGVVSTSGVAASRPEGAALAPARQRRVRLLIIKLGVVAAAGVALGTTLALTAASPGRPPGAH